MNIAILKWLKHLTDAGATVLKFVLLAAKTSNSGIIILCNLTIDNMVIMWYNGITVKELNYMTLLKFIAHFDVIILCIPIIAFLISRIYRKTKPIGDKWQRCVYIVAYITYWSFILFFCSLIVGILYILYIGIITIFG